MHSRKYAADINVWSLYCVRSQEHVDDLTAKQIKIICSSLPADDRTNWLAWHKGADEWKPIEKFVEFFPSDEAVEHKQATPPSNAEAPNFNDRLFEDETTMLNLNMADVSTSERRTHQRVLREFPVELRFVRGKMSSKTVDISIGGMKLEDKLPLATHSPFRAVITGPRGMNLEVQCALISNPNEQGGSRIKILMNPNVSLLRQWLLN